MLQNTLTRSDCPQSAPRHHRSQALGRGRNRYPSNDREDEATPLVCPLEFAPLELLSDACITENDRYGGGGSVMVWGGILGRYRTDLVVVQGNLTGIR